MSHPSDTCVCRFPDIRGGTCRECGRRAGPRAKKRQREMKEAAERVAETARRADLDL